MLEPSTVPLTIVNGFFFVNAVDPSCTANIQNAFADDGVSGVCRSWFDFSNYLVSFQKAPPKKSVHSF